MQKALPLQLAVAALAIVCYANTLVNDYAYDDVLIVRDSHKVNAAAGDATHSADGLGSWRAIWQTDYWSQSVEGWPGKDMLYRPVAVSSYRLVRVLAGPAAWPQHLVNILLHALASLLVVGVCLELMQGRGVADQRISAALAGALFAVLPIHNEAVASIVGRADLLVSAAVLSGLLAHRRLATAHGNGGVWQKLAWAAIGGFCLFAALGSKESGMAMAPIVIAWDWATRRSAGSHSIAAPTSVGEGSKAHRQAASRHADGRWWTIQTMWRLAYLFPPVAAYLWLRYRALGGELLGDAEFTKTVNVLVDAPAWQHILGVIQAFGMYWAKTLVPGTLSIGYSINSIRLATSPLDVHVALGAAAMFCLVAIVAWSRRVGRFGFAFAALALVIAYLPTSSAFNLIQVFFAERLWYTPSIFVCILLGFAAARVWSISAGRLAIVFVLTAFGLRLWVRNADWRDNGTLFAAAVRDQPDAVQPLYLLGSWLVEQGRPEEASGLLQKALEIDIGYTDAHRALGQAYARMNRLPEALHHLQSAAMQAPGHGPTEKLLAEVGSEVRTLAAADLDRLREAAAQAPDDLRAQLSWLTRLRELGRTAEALNGFAKSEARFTDRAEWHIEHAVTLVMANRLAEAIASYENSVQLDPRNPQAAMELAMLLLERRADGDVPRSLQLTGSALELAPSHPAAYAARAEALAVSGDLAGAFAAYHRAIALLPPESAQRRTYEQRARALGARE